MTRLTLLALCFVLAVPSVAGAQQDVSSLLNRIDRLERELADLQRTVFAGDQPAAAPSATASSLVQPDASGGTPLARIEVRLQQIEAELRAVTGRVEELGFQVQQVSGRMDRMETDTDLRFRELSGDALPPQGGTSGLAGAPSPTPSLAGGAPATAASASTAPLPAPATAPVPGAPAQSLGTLSGSDLAALQATPVPAPAAPPADTAVIPPVAPSAAPAVAPPADPKDEYEAAFNNLMRHDLASAEAAFIAFLAAHPEDPLAGNAQYWLGETYYARNRFEDAAVAFLDGYQTYPNSPKAPDNLLKLGMSLFRIDRKEEACATFAKLSQDFPNLGTNIKRRLVAEVRTLNCGG